MDNGELNNRRVLALAKAHECTVERVHEALDQHPVSTDRETFLRRTLALELMRLDQLEMAFEDKVLKDKDVSSGALLVKIAERRQILLGLAAPVGHAVMIHSEPVEQRQTSTERIRAAIDRIRFAKQPQPNGDGEPEGEAN
jgi:hypothetical protein